MPRKLRAVQHTNSSSFQRKAQAMFSYCPLCGSRTLCAMDERSQFACMTCRHVLRIVDVIAEAAAHVMTKSEMESSQKLFILAERKGGGCCGKKGGAA